MIIQCDKCKKKFNIDQNLIPPEGRIVQCGSCNQSWHFRLNMPPEKALNEDKEEYFNLKINLSTQNNQINKNEGDKEDDKNKPQNIIKENEISQKIERNKKSHITKFFSYIVVFVISFISMIILIDTLKNPLIKFFPGLEIILFNLNETLKDLKLFIIDLY